MPPIGTGASLHVTDTCASFGGASMVRRWRGGDQARTASSHEAPTRRQRAPNQLEDHAVTLGPLAYTVIGSQGKQEPDGSIRHELEKVVANGTIRIVDLVFI